MRQLAADHELKQTSLKQSCHGKYLTMLTNLHRLALVWGSPTWASLALCLRWAKTFLGLQAQQAILCLPQLRRRLRQDCPLHSQACLQPTFPAFLLAVHGLLGDIPNPIRQVLGCRSHRSQVVILQSGRIRQCQASQACLLRRQPTLGAMQRLAVGKVL